jgi:hypothetical protein
MSVSGLEHSPRALLLRRAGRAANYSGGKTDVLRVLRQTGDPRA